MTTTLLKSPADWAELVNSWLQERVLGEEDTIPHSTFEQLLRVNRDHRAFRNLPNISLHSVRYLNTLLDTSLIRPLYYPCVAQWTFWLPDADNAELKISFKYAH